MSEHLSGPLWALLATVGYCLLYRAPARDVAFASVGGGLAWGAALAMEDGTGSKVLAYFAASIVVGLYAEILAALRRRPPSVYIYAAIIPLVPGGGMYYTMLAAVNGRGTEASRIGFETISLAGAIASGLALAASVARVATVGRALARRKRA